MKNPNLIVVMRGGRILRASLLFNVLLASAASFLLLLPNRSMAANLPIYMGTQTVGSTSSESYRAIATDSIGNSYVTGFFEGTIDFNPTAGEDIKSPTGIVNNFITKLGPDGSYFWTYTFATPPTSSVNMQIVSMDADSDNNLITSGWFTDDVDFDPTNGTDIRIPTGDDGNRDSFISKIGSDGSYLWTKTFGGTSSGEIRDIKADSLGNIFATGYFEGTTNLDPELVPSITSHGRADVFISKFSSSGTFLWGETFGGLEFDQPQGLSLDSAENPIVIGQFQQEVFFDPARTDSRVSHGNVDIFVTKFNNLGSYGWTSAYGGVNNDSASSLRVAADSLGGLFAVGGFANSMDFDPGISSNIITPAGANDIYISKFLEDGSYQWTKTIGLTGNIGALGIATGEDGELLLSGWFTGSVDFDTSEGENIITNNGDGNAFIALFNNDGSSIWAYSIGGALFEISYGLSWANNVITSIGTFQGTVNFDPITGSDIKTSSGADDAYISRFALINEETATYSPVSDSYLRNGQPNKNWGTETSIRIRANGNNRSLVDFNSAALQDFINGKEILSAKLMLFISVNSNNWGASGRDVSIHRMLQPWTELGVTWNCPDDVDTANATPDCIEWDMSSVLSWPLSNAPTDTILHENNQNGWVEWDVASDVQLFADGASNNYGWLIKKVNEGQSGSVEYSSKEGENSPQLILTVQ